MEKKPPFDDKRMQVFVGNTLKYSMYSSMIIAIIGILMYFIKNGNQQEDLQRFSHFHEPTENPIHVFIKGLQQCTPASIIELGVLVLLLTPILRLIFASYGYLKEKDYLYTFIGIFVIGIIVLSLFLGAHE